MDLIHPLGAAAVELFDSPSDFDPSDGESPTKVLQLCLLFGLHVGVDDEFQTFPAITAIHLPFIHSYYCSFGGNNKKNDKFVSFQTLKKIFVYIINPIAKTQDFV